MSPEVAARAAARDDPPIAGGSGQPSRGFASLGLRDVLRRVVQGLIYPPLTLGVALRVENLPDLARRGPVILAPNHCSFLDPIVLQLVSPVHLNYLMTEIFYRVRWQAWLYRLWGAIPVPEGGSAAGALKRALRVIRSGDPVVIFPEGRISPDGYLQDGRGGVVTLISRSRVPVIPVAILGTHRVLPRSARFPRAGRVVVRFGEPIVPDAASAGTRPAEYLERIMSALVELGVPRREMAGPGA